jgi:hypothetical protein
MIPVYICILMDCTGSMQTWINAARDQIRTILDQTRQTHPTAAFQVGFVGYRDFGDREQLITIPFTVDIEDLRRQIGQIQADGGNDCAEDVAGGLEAALNMFQGITTGVRQVVHIADAPAHGNMYHDVIVSDRYPQGDPNGRNPETIIHQLSILGIDYTIVRVDTSTDTMIELFHNSYTNQQCTFRVLDLVEQRRHIHRRGAIHYDNIEDILTPQLAQNITQTISRYTASQDPEEV